MFIVSTPTGIEPFQIDVSEFPDGCARSQEGSLHVRPSATMTVTSGELEILRKHVPRIIVRGKTKQPAPPASVGKPGRPPVLESGRDREISEKTVVDPKPNRGKDDAPATIPDRKGQDGR